MATELPVCLSACLPVCLSACLPAHMLSAVELTHATAQTSLNLLLGLSATVSVYEPAVRTSASRQRNGTKRTTPQVDLRRTLLATRQSTGHSGISVRSSLL